MDILDFNNLKFDINVKNAYSPFPDHRTKVYATDDWNGSKPFKNILNVHSPFCKKQLFSTVTILLKVITQSYG